MVSALAHLSTHLHPDSSRRSSFRRRKSRSRSPSVHPQPPSPTTTGDEAKTVQPTTRTVISSAGDTITTTAAVTTASIPTTVEIYPPQPEHIDQAQAGDQGRLISSKPMDTALGFADTVNDVVGMVKYETSRKGRAKCIFEAYFYY